MTQALFRENVVSDRNGSDRSLSEPRGVALDHTVFYPQGGGQSGDQGSHQLEMGRCFRSSIDLHPDRATLLHVPTNAPPCPALAHA